jgi:Flp pilus assembly protein TadD
VRIDWDYASEPGQPLTGFEFRLFSPVRASKYYLFNTRIDIEPPAGHVLRTEPHPRYFTDDTGTCPLAMIGHLQNEWYPRLTFVVFRAPRPGERHVFRKGEPFAQILFVPQQASYQLTPMSEQRLAERRRLEQAIQSARLEIAENVWEHPDNVKFNNHYKVLARVFVKDGLPGVEREVAAAALRHDASLPTGKSVAEYLALGKERLAANDFEEAHRLLAQAFALEPRNADVLMNLGICFACFGGIDKGLELMHSAVAIEPTNAGFLRNLGELLRRMGRLDAAEPYLRRAVQCDGNDPSTLFVLAMILLPQGRIAEGLEAYHAAARIGVPTDAHFGVGMALAQQGQFAAARDCFETVLAADPQHGLAREALARLGPNPL